MRLTLRADYTVISGLIVSGAIRIGTLRGAEPKLSRQLFRLSAEVHQPIFYFC